MDDHIDSVRFFVRFPDGAVHELRPRTVRMSCGIDELPVIEGEYILGGEVEADIGAYTDENRLVAERNEVLDKFLSQFKIYAEAGDSG